MITSLLYIIILLSLIGKICIIKNKFLYGFILWTITDLFLMLYNWSIKENAQSILFAVFSLFSIWGIFSSLKNKGGLISQQKINEITQKIRYKIS